MKSARKRRKAADRENPEWSGEMFARARLVREVMPDLVASPPRRGRPKKEKPLVQVSLRVDADALATLKAEGTGWQALARRAIAREARRLRRKSPARRGTGGRSR